MNRRKKFINNNNISLEKLNLMNKNQCVKVSVSFIYCLIAKYGFQEEIDENILEILKKYSDMITIYEFLEQNICTYCLMTVNDILLLISTLGINSYPKGKILICNEECDFNEYYDKLKAKYFSKILEKHNNEEYHIVRKRIQ